MTQRRHLLEVDETGGSDLGATEMKTFQCRQPREVRQARTGDRCAVEYEMFQPGQPREMRQARVGDLGVSEGRSFSAVNPVRCARLASVTWSPMRRNSPSVSTSAYQRRRRCDLVANEEELYNLPLFVFVTQTPPRVSPPAPPTSEEVSVPAARRAAY